MSRILIRAFIDDSPSGGGEASRDFLTENMDLATQVCAKLGWIASDAAYEI